MRRLPFALLVLGLASCATLTRDSSIDQRYGPPDPTRYDKPAQPEGGMSYRADVQPILERRCVVCHGCYDAPCQLKLGAWEGVARGASTATVYDGGRLGAAPPTRLFVDAAQPSEWRKKDFFAVLNERAPTPEANLAASVLYRSLALKRAHPLPGDAVLPKPFDFSLDRTQYCPRIDQYESYERQFPLAGMPYGLPGLDQREFDTLARWLAAGAPYEGPAPLPANVTRDVQAWEAFLNGDSPKERLMSRYLYEHLFLGILYFDADTGRRAFRIVRSATPPGTPVALIATRRPYDDPGVPRVYYRLVPERETLLAKTHMPYALSPERMAKFRTWFLDASYEVDALPSYAVEVSSNPFVAFSAIPPDSRYRFMLDEAQYFIMNFIKGPVCRGQLAVDVIEDRFWVFFVDPKSGASEANAELIARQSSNLRLPAEWGSDSAVLRPWLQYAALETKFLQAKTRALDQALAGPGKIDLSLDLGRRRAQPERGADRVPPLRQRVGREGAGGRPAEDGVGDRLPAVRAHLLPARRRLRRVRQRRAPAQQPPLHGLHAHGGRVQLPRVPAAGGARADPRLLVPRRVERGEGLCVRPQRVSRPRDRHRLPHRGSAARALRHAPRAPRAGAGAALRPLDRGGRSLAAGPAGARRRARGEHGLAARGRRSCAWTTRRARRNGSPCCATPAHSNVSHIFLEGSELLPAENTLTVVAGFIGAYPNAIYRVRRADLPALTAAIRGLASEGDYRKLADRFAVRRTDPAFWAASDAMNDAYAQSMPLEAGLFDYNRLENR